MGPPSSSSGFFFSSLSQLKMSRVSIVSHDLGTKAEVAQLENMISERDAKIDSLTSGGYMATGHRGSSIEMRKVSINAGAAKRPLTRPIASRRQKNRSFSLSLSCRM